MRTPDRPSPRAVSTRRAFLGGVLGIGALAGCDALTGVDRGEPEPDQLEGFLRATVALGDQYDLAMSAVPSLTPILTPLRDAHRAHARDLAAAIGTPVPAASPVPAPVPSDRTLAVAALAEAEKAARDQAVAACVAAPGRLAAVLGSVAAARASHLEVLK